MYLLVYVDDIAYVCNNAQLLSHFIISLPNKFSPKDMDDLQYFLGVEVVPSKKGLFLSQMKYIIDIFERQRCQIPRRILHQWFLPHLFLFMMVPNNLMQLCVGRLCVAYNTSHSCVLILLMWWINCPNSCINHLISIGKPLKKCYDIWKELPYLAYFWWRI